MGTITSFSVLFFHMGFLASLRVLLANSINKVKSANLVGTGFLITTVQGILFSLFIFLLSFFIDGWFDTQIGNYLYYLAPLCFIYPFRLYLQSIATGVSKFTPWAFFDLFSKALFLGLLLLLWNNNSISLWWVMLLNLLTTIVAFFLIFPLYKPKFNNITESFNLIWLKNKSYGIHYYAGTLTTLSTYRLDELLIVFFIDTTHLGFYTLAAIICSPMVVMSQSLSNAMFKRFALDSTIPTKVFIINTLWLIACVFGIYLVGGFIIDILFGEGYKVIKLYIVPLSIAYFFQGMYQPYNFLAAKGLGKEIRNVSFVESGINIIGNFTLIPLYGVSGAIIASIVAKFIHWLGKVYYYKKYLNSQRSD